ncbi:TonB-dependent receptor plug domain-containing protein [Salinicola peritrichatus]|uniref:TonB-dependent receptor plug domain-containing protein n=1 Tax=Salinicola peritrichatus TaxID=1267424 RepID=UPI001EF7E9E2|nr:TonB-dependent receptor plug domain-containing protein [Salinicola peritrichatus]
MLDSTTEGTDSFTAQRTTIGLAEKEIKEIPQSVSVLTRERLDDQNLTSLKEAMEHTTGVSVQSYGPNQYQLRSRGYDIDSMMLDGSRVEAPSAALSNSGLYDTALYDRIEVMRGPPAFSRAAASPVAPSIWYANARNAISASTCRCRGAVGTTTAARSTSPVR